VNPADGAIRAAVDRAIRAYRERYGSEPQWAGYAPGRVNLIGEHTDYTGGLVLPMAIDRYCAVAIGPGDGLVRIGSADVPGEATFEAGTLAGPEAVRGNWTGYVMGVIVGYRRLGMPPLSVKMMAASDVPVGAGLSSSAALEVAAAMALESVWRAAGGRDLDALERAKLCQRAEHEFANVPCGIMDQLASVMGKDDHALLIDCASLSIRSVRLGGPEELLVLVADTGVRHALAEGAYEERRLACDDAARILGVTLLSEARVEDVVRARPRLGDVRYRCARHVATENGRTARAAERLEAGDYGGVGTLMLESHGSLRDDFGVSCPELDALVEWAADHPAVYGAKMTGAGFGGSVVILAQPGGAAGLVEMLQRRNAERFGHPCSVARVVAVRGSGAVFPG
jgi:galactokinase